jgi:poly(3-hydroxybutyrate) depolymerase
MATLPKKRFKARAKTLECATLALLVGLSGGCGLEGTAEREELPSRLPANEDEQASRASALLGPPNALCTSAGPTLNVGCWEVLPAAHNNYSAWRHVRTPDGHDRRYKAHGNPNLYPPQNAPLVIGFHAFTQPVELSNGYEAMTGLTAKADASGFIVAYPEGLGSSWNAGDCCGTAKIANIDDVAFSNELINDLQRVLLSLGRSLDAKRVYATGFSNGAFMTYRLACDLSNRIAAIAPVAGVMSRGACAGTNVPVVHFHGLNDALSPFEGGHPSLAIPGSVTPFLSVVTDSTTPWNARNGCTTTHPSATIATAYGTVSCWTGGPSPEYNSCRLVQDPRDPLDVGRVSLCTVSPGAHNWVESTGGLATAFMWDLVFSRTQLP